MTLAYFRTRLSLHRGKNATLFSVLLLGIAGFLWKGADSLSKDKHTPQSADRAQPVSRSSPALAGASAASPAAAAGGTRDELSGISLGAALDLARREITGLDAREAALPLNGGVTHFAWNPSQGYTARFLSGGSVRFDSGDQENGWQVGFRYSGAGDASEVTVEGTRAEFLHPDGVREWFENDSAGIQHGFTLDQRLPKGVRLEIALDGMGAIRESADDARTLLMQDAQGPRLRYAGLKAWDADGKDLLAAMDATVTGLAITVDDRGARYPLTIDPLITVLSQELDPPISGPGSALDFFGCSVAFDGDTALVGAAHDHSASGGQQAGNAYIFTRSGEGANETWTLQGRLGYGGSLEKVSFGSVVALQGDIAVVGVPQDGPGYSAAPGSVRVWARGNGQWTEQARITQPLIDYPDPPAKSRIGWQLALSGETLVLGIPAKDQVEVYTRSGTQWSKQQTISTPWINATLFGCSVAVEGDSLAVGADGSTSEGCVYHYTRSNGVWSGVKLPTPADLEEGDHLGAEVAISGNTILATASGRRCVYAFEQTGQNWSAGTKVNSGALEQDIPYFGHALAIEGDHALIGASDRSFYYPFDDVTGKVFSARRIGGVWQLTGMLADSGRQGRQSFGCSVAIRGTRALVGAMTRTTAGGRMTGDATFYHLENDIWTPGVTVDLGDDGEGSGYGRAVAVDGDILAIGAGAESNADGLRHEAVHVFTRAGTGWAHQVRLGDPFPTGDPLRSTGFGSSLAISGGTLVAGSPIRSNGSYPPAEDGCVYIYERSGEEWNLVSDFAGTGQFGISLAAEGNTIAIGAPSFQLPGESPRQGKVFIYTRGATAWTQTAELLAPAATDCNNFGRSVALDGNTLLAGAPYSLGEEWDNEPFGAVMVFRRSGTAWEEEAVISNPFDEGFFGYSVDISGDHALVAAPGYDDASYLFLHRNGTTWTRGDSHYLDGLRSLTGNQVALAGHAAVISADNNTMAPGICKLLEFTAGHWLPSRDLGTTGRTVAMDDNTLVVGDPLAERANPTMSDISVATGHVWIYDLSGAEKYLLQSFDQDQDLRLDPDEWLAIYGSPAPATAGAVHGFIDADADGFVTESELVEAAQKSVSAKDKTGSAAVAVLTRVHAFLELDGSVSGGARDGIVNRAEIALMWKPGTASKPIDAFWKRAKVPAGYDLRTWLQAKTLPSMTTYASARQSRSRRRSLALRYDLDFDGKVHFSEFYRMLEVETGNTKKYQTLWDTLNNRPKRLASPSEISIDAFVEAAKFPSVLVGK